MCSKKNLRCIINAPKGSALQNDRLPDDSSIIDVTGRAYSLSSVQSTRTGTYNVPHWPRQHIYSRSDINDATRRQQEFYQLFRTRFFANDVMDLEGNTNYAFVLLFDLVEQYHRHKNLLQLEAQLLSLAAHYPRTRSYALNFLRRKMRENGDIIGLARSMMQDAFYSKGNDLLHYRLGTQYRNLLGLDAEQVALLNKIKYSANSFIGIKGCCLAVVRLFLAAIAELDKFFTKQGTNIDREFALLGDLVTQKHHRCKLRDPDYQFRLKTSIGQLHTLVFRHCENSVRQAYHHKRMINTTPGYPDAMVNKEIETRLVSRLIALLPKLIPAIPQPDDDSEKALNKQNAQRWKLKFESITADYKNAEDFGKSILHLARLNEKNPSARSIFFEAVKFISKLDKEMALEMYIHYLYYDIQSGKEGRKRLTATIRKLLFQTGDQLQDFETIISGLQKDKDLVKALARIRSIYTVKRKRIQLDNTLIAEVQLQHTETVELLDEYLQGDSSEGHDQVRSEQTGQFSIKAGNINETAPVSPFRDLLAFEPVHCKLLELFVKNNFSLPANELNAFARANAVFPDQLVERINEICYEQLDDLLIEEEHDHYTVNKLYYQHLSAYDK